MFVPKYRCRTRTKGAIRDNKRRRVGCLEIRHPSLKPEQTQPDRSEGERSGESGMQLGSCYEGGGVV